MLAEATTVHIVIVAPHNFVHLSHPSRCQKLTDFWAAMEVGPAREGIQKKPSVRRPSSATFDSALQSTTSHEMEL